MERIIITVRATACPKGSVAIGTGKSRIDYNFLQPATVMLREIIDKRVISEVLFHWFTKIMRFKLCHNKVFCPNFTIFAQLQKKAYEI